MGDFIEVVKTRVEFRAFDVPDVVAVQSALFGKIFLRPAAPGAQEPHAQSKQIADRQRQVRRGGALCRRGGLLWQRKERRQKR